VAAVSVLLAVAAGCGSDDTTEDTSGVAGSDVAEAAWTRQVLEPAPGADTPVLVGAAGDDVVVVTVTEDGTVVGAGASGDGAFRSGSPAATGLRFLRLGGVARFGDAWWAVGSGGADEDETGDLQPTFALRVVRSTDGRTWESVDATGLDGPADVTGVAAVDGGLVAVGSRRTAEDPSQGGFRPVAWRSPDGERWTEVALPDAAAGGEGSVQGVAASGGAVVAVGQVGDAARGWRSGDGGASWDVVVPSGDVAPRSLASVAATGDAVVISGLGDPGPDAPGGAQLLHRSADGGRTWRAVAEPPPSGGDMYGSPVSAGGGRFLTVRRSFVDGFADPELCYADIDRCRQGASASLYVSDEAGEGWRRVDTSGVATDPTTGAPGELAAVAVTDGGRVVGVRRVAGGTEAWTWPAGVELPVTGEPTDPATDVELLAEGEAPEPGRRYAQPLYVHCGMGWLYLGGQPWQRLDDGPDVETGAGDELPAGWPVAQQTIFGFAELVAADRVEYSLADGEVIATYGPPAEPPPGCD
jgi:hypothetical protein